MVLLPKRTMPRSVIFCAWGFSGGNSNSVIVLLSNRMKPRSAPFGLGCGRCCDVFLSAMMLSSIWGTVGFGPCVSKLTLAAAPLKKG